MAGPELSCLCAKAEGAISMAAATIATKGAVRRLHQKARRPLASRARRVCCVSYFTSPVPFFLPRHHPPRRSRSQCRGNMSP